MSNSRWRKKLQSHYSTVHESGKLDSTRAETSVSLVAFCSQLEIPRPGCPPVSSAAGGLFKVPRCALDLPTDKAAAIATQQSVSRHPGRLMSTIERFHFPSLECIRFVVEGLENLCVLPKNLLPSLSVHYRVI